jgi:hypothetical protein
VQLISRHELAFVTATLTYRGTTIDIPDVLVDTGAASTVINADLAADAGIYLGPNDRLRRLRDPTYVDSRTTRATACSAIVRHSGRPDRCLSGVRPDFMLSVPGVSG